MFYLNFLNNRIFCRVNNSFQAQNNTTYILNYSFGKKTTDSCVQKKHIIIS